MSKIFSGIKKVVKGAVDAVKSVVSGVKKAFKKVWSSTIGKIIIIAVVIYVAWWAINYLPEAVPLLEEGTALTGAELEAAQAGLTASEQAFATQVGAEGTATAEMTANSVVIPGGEGASTAVVDSTSALGEGGVETGNLASQQAGGNVGIKTGMEDILTGRDLLMKKITGLGGWAQENQLLAAMGLNVGANMLTDSPAEERAKEEQRIYDRKRRNMAQLEDVNLNIAPGDPILKDMHGNPIYDPKTGRPMQKESAGLVDKAMVT